MTGVQTCALPIYKSHPFQAKYAKNEMAIFLHAEVHAIKNALREVKVDELSKCDIYITRVKRKQAGDSQFIWGLSKPCPGCARAIAEFGIRRTIYTCDDGTYEVMK